MFDLFSKFIFGLCLNFSLEENSKFPFLPKGIEIDRNCNFLYPNLFICHSVSNSVIMCTDENRT